VSAVDHEAAVARLLADLGDTADAVADRLRALEIKGRRKEPCACPIANYLLSKTDAVEVSVIQARSRFIILTPIGSRWQRVPNPEPVGEFLKRFDQGVYLDLVEVAG
jgi:hypothetical protein